MGNNSSNYLINFEDIKYALNNKNNYVIINTLSNDMQSCLILNTIKIDNEEQIINNLLKSNNNINIIVYGKNNNDISVYTKHKQLKNLGFSSVFIYIGGIFEWLMLQELYGEDEFPTTSYDIDILKYKPLSSINTNRYLLTN